MSHPPSGPSAPPPGGGAYGGQSPYGFQSDPDGRSGLGKGIIAVIAGFVVLVLAVCCLGGFFLLRDGDDGDSGSSTTTSEEPTDEPTDEPSEEPSEDPSDEPTEEPTEEPGEEPTEEPSEDPSDEPTDEPSDEPTDDETDDPTGGSDETTVTFPESFDGWSNLSSQPSATIAIFAKDEQSFNVLSADYASVETYEKLWESPQAYGAISCGQRAGHSAVSCAVEEHDTTYYATSSDLEEEELADAVETMLAEM